MRARPFEEEASGVRRSWWGPGLLAILLLLLAAAIAWQQARRALLLGLEETAEAHRRAVLAVLDTGEGLEVPAAGRDESERRERALAAAAALVAALDGRAIRLALVDADPAPGLDRSEAIASELAPLSLWLVHRLEEGALLRASFAAAAPWSAAAGLLALGLALAARRERREVVRRAARDRERAEGERALRARLAETEAHEALLLATVEAIGEGVAILAPDGRPIVVNTAFRRGLAGRGLELRSEPGARFDLEALSRIEELRRFELAAGQLLLLLEASAVLPARAPLGPTGPRLAGIVQELGEALARVAREAVVLHELASDPALKARLERLRAAAERCTRLVAPLLAPPRPVVRRPVALDRLLEERTTGRAGGQPPVLLGIAPRLPPASADPERLAALLDGLVGALAAGSASGSGDGRGEEPAPLRVRLRRGGAGLVLDLERLGSGEEEERELDPLLWAERAREAGASLALERSETVRCVRLELPIHPAGQATRLVVIEGEGGGRAAGAATG
ncbi:MAG: hypothetical protein RMK81_07595 [Geminicoccaceae bacterium]|nr:hypothetical protein [Geminicoccaceae bacterium]